MENDFSSWRILAVDDEPDNLKLLADLLEFQGATVYRAEDGQRALAAVDEFIPNVILVDLAMPGLDGWEMQRRLRARDDLRSVPIVAVSALAMPEDIERAKMAGFDGYITKPYRIKTLLDELVSSVRPFFDNNHGENGSH